MLVACENSVSNNTDLRSLKAPVISVKEINARNNIVSILAVASWSDGCGSFSHYSVNSNNKDISIVIYVNKPSELACPAVMISFDAPIDIVVDGAGDYNFHFWQTDSTSLDTTFTVR